MSRHAKLCKACRDVEYKANAKGRRQIDREYRERKKAQLGTDAFKAHMHQIQRRYRLRKLARGYAQRVLAGERLVLSFKKVRLEPSEPS